jgi:hypothetical protein
MLSMSLQKVLQMGLRVVKINVFISRTQDCDRLLDRRLFRQKICLINLLISNIFIKIFDSLILHLIFFILDYLIITLILDLNNLWRLLARFRKFDRPFTWLQDDLFRGRSVLHLAFEFFKLLLTLHFLFNLLLLYFLNVNFHVIP